MFRAVGKSKNSLQGDHNFAPCKLPQQPSGKKNIKNHPRTAEKPRPMSCALDCTWPAMRAMRFMVRRERGKSMGKGWEQVHCSQGHPKVAKFSVQLNHKKVSLNRNQNKFTKNVVSRKTVSTSHIFARNQRANAPGPPRRQVLPPRQQLVFLVQPGRVGEILVQNSPGNKKKLCFAAVPWCSMVKKEMKPAIHWNQVCNKCVRVEFSGTWTTRDD